MDFEVMRQDLGVTRVMDLGVPEIGAGQVLLRVDAFALTSNNITYGVFGDMLRYWEFFAPSSDDGWGRIPAFGFADVVATNHPDVEIGLRVFGYFPMSSHLVVTPIRVNSRGFTEGAEHRQTLAAAYNHYQRVDTDPGYNAALEAEQMLLRPLFSTGFLIEDFLFDNDRFGATTIVLSSASSKTAVATAFQLKARGDSHVVGLTSEGNRTFVEGLGVHDQVATYDEVSSLGTGSTAYIDLSGSGALRDAIHLHLGDNLTYDMIVGATHWADAPASADLPGAAPEMFFAPTQIAKRAKDWGTEIFDQRSAEAWNAYVAWVAGTLDIKRAAGADALSLAFHDLLEGGGDPSAGHVISLNQPA